MTLIQMCSLDSQRVQGQIQEQTKGEGGRGGGGGGGGGGDGIQLGAPQDILGVFGYYCALRQLLM